MNNKVEKVEIEVKYKNKIYAFDNGYRAYIFHTGVYNNVDAKFGIKGLLDYVSLVVDCYLSDDNLTPLGDLSDFIAQNWKEFKKLHHKDILDMFYDKYFQGI